MENELYKEYKVYGPYIRKDNRMHVVLVHYVNKSRLTISYPKFLVERHLNRKLKPDETVDHIDRDITNNDLSNLQILNKSEHSSLDAVRLAPQEFTCPVCNMLFVLEGKKLGNAVSNRNKGSAGPFCGRSCAGKYGHSVQTGSNKFSKTEIITEYYQIDK
jgi:hypothetical protein